MVSDGLESRAIQELAYLDQAPYNPHAMQSMLVSEYGAGNVHPHTLLLAGQRNAHLAGMRHPITGIVYDARGFPVFDGVTVFETRLASKLAYEGTRSAHQVAATKALKEAVKTDERLAAQFSKKQLEAIQSGSSHIPEYTWHHHQDTGRMQLIPRPLHRETGHIGGAKLWIQE